MLRESWKADSYGGKSVVLLILAIREKFKIMQNSFRRTCHKHKSS